MVVVDIEMFALEFISRAFLFPEILPRKIFKGLYETQEMAFLEISIAVTYA